MTQEQINNFIAQAIPGQMINVTMPIYVLAYKGNFVGSNEKNVLIKDDRNITMVLEKSKIGDIF